MFRLTVREIGVVAFVAAALVIGLVVHHFRHREAAGSQDQPEGSGISVIAAELK